MRTHWNIQTPVGEFVKENTLCAETFENLSIDFCCGGEKTLENACLEQGLKPLEVLEQLNLLENSVQNQDVDLDGLTPGQLTLHIESKHHAYLKKALPRLVDLLEKVLSAHGKMHSELKGLKTTFACLREDLEPHLLKEESVLFPLIRKLESQNLGNGMKGIAGPIQVMLKEHDHVGDLLKKIRELTRGFEVPEDGCQSFHLLYEELNMLERDTHLHIHKENNVLFPRIQPTP